MVERPSKIRSLLALLAVASFSLSTLACGGSSKVTHATSQTAAAANATSSVATTTATSATQTPGSFKGDEDDDDTAGNYTGNGKKDNDADFDNDQSENTGYHDSDDNLARTYGHAANATDRRAITVLVKRYYAAAAAGDGAKACPLIYSLQAEAIPEDYGQSPGPTYARGKTCAVVMSKIFKHSHGQVTGTVEVTDARVSGSEAHALFGSSTIPASSILLRREHGAWKIDALLGQPLP